MKANTTRYTSIFRTLSLILALSMMCRLAIAQENIFYDAERTRNTNALPANTKFVDQWGYPWVNNGGGGSTESLTTATIFQCNKFRLIFADFDNGTNKGYADPAFVSLAPGHPLGASTTLGALRRWTACQVFNYISQTIDVPGGASAPDVFFDVSELDGTGALGFATPFFATPINPASFNGGLLNQHIVTGIDPTPNPGDYDAMLTFDFGPNNAWPSNGGNVPINSDAFLTNAGGIDLFSVILHEATHALGFFSNIQSNGNSYVTNSSPGLYSLFDRYILNSSNANIINNSSFAFQGGVPQLTSNFLKYFKSTNTKPYSVYSPVVWKTGSSLSHFDEVRDNNEPYVMTATYAGGLKRSYTKGELEVLCNLGYTLTVSGFSCSDRYAVGVNDFSSTTIATPVTVNVILNDYDPDGQAIGLDISSVTMLNNAGTASASGNSITFTPNGSFAGNALIRYRPYTIANGYTGSYATLTVNIQSPGFCPLDPCNLICNGSFEEGLTLPQFETICAINVFRTVENGGIPGWFNLGVAGTSDSYFRGSTVQGPTPGIPAMGIPINFAAQTPPGVQTPTIPNNNRYAGMFQGRQNGSGCLGGSEGIYRDLVQPLVAGTTYKLTYSARAICRCHTFAACVPAFLNTSFSTTLPTAPFGNCPAFNGTNLNSASIQVVNPSSPNNIWTNVSFTFTAAQNSGYIVVQPIISSAVVNGNDCDIPYIFVDNFRLEKVGNQIATSVTTSNANPKVGQNVTFTINVCNTTTTAVNNVGVANLLPAGLNLVSSNFNAYPNHTFATLAAGACATLTVTAQVQSSVAFNTDLQNCVGVTTANSCAQAQACATVRVLATDISVNAVQQTCSSFRAIISNLGNVSAHNLTLSYTPPSCFGYQSYSVISGSATYSGSQITIPLITPGSSTIIEFTGSTGIPAGCVNTVNLTAAFDEWDLNPNNNSGSVTMSGVSSLLSASVTPSNVNPQVGQNVTFTINVCNNTSGALSNVSISNMLPAGFSFVSSTFSGYPNHTFSVPASGCASVTVTAQAQSSVAFNTDLQNCATVTLPGCSGVQACGTVRVLATDIEVSTTPQSCTAFLATITNTGTITAHNITLNYTPPSCFGYQSYSVLSGTATYAANQVSISSLAAGSSVIIQFNGTATIPPNCINTISLTGLSEWDLNTSNNTASVSMPGANNQLTATVVPSNTSPQVGQNVTFTITVCNNTSSAVSNISVNNTLPAGLIFVSSTFSAYPNHTFSSIPAGGCVSVTVTAQVQSTVVFNTELPDCATITGGCAPIQACGSIRVKATDISINTSVQDCYNFRASIANIGSVAANNVVVNYAPPPCFGFQSYTVTSGTAFFSGSQIIIPFLAPGASVGLVFTGSGTIAPGCLNTLTLFSLDEWDVNPSNNSSTANMPGPGCTPAACINLPRTQ